MENRDVFIYVSSPVRQLRGGFRVGQVWRGSPNDIWHKVSGLVGIDKQVYDSYYAGKTIAYALEITDVWECENPIDLYTLREQFPNFVVPQSWRYVRSVEHGVFLTCQSAAKKQYSHPRMSTRFRDNGVNSLSDRMLLRKRGTSKPTKNSLGMGLKSTNG